MAGIEKGDIMNYLNIFKHKYFLILWVFFVVVIGVFLLIMIENVFPPIPSEVILLFGGFVVLFSSIISILKSKSDK